MKQNIIRKTCQVVPAVLMTGALAACDAHIEESDTKQNIPDTSSVWTAQAIPYSEYEQFRGNRRLPSSSISAPTEKRKATAMPSICGT